MDNKNILIGAGIGLLSAAVTTAFFKRKQIREKINIFKDKVTEKMNKESK